MINWDFVCFNDDISDNPNARPLEILMLTLRNAGAGDQSISANDELMRIPTIINAGAVAAAGTN